MHASTPSSKPAPPALCPWGERAKELSDLAEALGRVPTNADGVDPDVLSWIKNQRRARLSDAQQHVLESIVGWSWNPRDDVWERRIGQAEQFYVDTKRAPSRSSTVGHERALAYWWRQQLRRLADHRLPHHRVARTRALKHRVESISR